MTSDFIHCFGTNLNKYIEKRRSNRLIYQVFNHIIISVNFLSINADHICKSWSITVRFWNIKRLLQTMYFVPIKQFHGVKVYVLFAFKKIDISCRKVLNKTHFLPFWSVWNRVSGIPSAPGVITRRHDNHFNGRP